MAGTVRAALALTATACLAVVSAVIPLRLGKPPVAAELTRWSQPDRPPQHSMGLMGLGALGQSGPFGGTPAVGALFTTTADGGPGIHFCTASVVDSPSRDLLITAAHCVTGAARGPILFVPGYHDGQAPYGVWHITHVTVNGHWSSAGNPDDDFAFLVATRPGDTKIQDITGGERLGIGQPAGGLVTAVGYPDTADTPIVCLNDAQAFGPAQLEFDCPGYTDGTSGGPMLAGVDPATGLGTVMGVIGGYEQGGLTPAVSYAARLGGSAATLFGVAAIQAWRAGLPVREPLSMPGIA